MITFAKGLGVKSFRFGTLKVEFHAADALPPRHREAVGAPARAEAEKPRDPAVTAAQALDKINEYIYGQDPSGPPVDPHEPH